MRLAKFPGREITEVPMPMRGGHVSEDKESGHLVCSPRPETGPFGVSPRYRTQSLLAIPIVDFGGTLLGVIQAINKLGDAGWAC